MHGYRARSALPVWCSKRVWTVGLCGLVRGPHAQARLCCHALGCHALGCHVLACRVLALALRCWPIARRRNLTARPLPLACVWRGLTPPEDSVPDRQWIMPTG